MVSRVSEEIASNDTKSVAPISGRSRGTPPDIVLVRLRKPRAQDRWRKATCEESSSALQDRAARLDLRNGRCLPGAVDGRGAFRSSAPSRDHTGTRPGQGIVRA